MRKMTCLYQQQAYPDLYTDTHFKWEDQDHDTFSGRTDRASTCFRSGNTDRVAFNFEFGRYAQLINCYATDALHTPPTEAGFLLPNCQ